MSPLVSAGRSIDFTTNNQIDGVLPPSAYEEQQQLPLPAPSPSIPVDQPVNPTEMTGETGRQPHALHDSMMSSRIDGSDLAWTDTGSVGKPAIPVLGRSNNMLEHTTQAPTANAATVSEDCNHANQLHEPEMRDDITERVVKRLCGALGVSDLSTLQLFVAKDCNQTAASAATQLEISEPDYISRDVGCLRSTSTVSQEINHPRRPPVADAAGSQQQVLATFSHSVVKSKWVDPEHIEKLNSQTEDYDWWFYMMHTHLNNCGIIEKYDRLHFTRRYCDDDFRNDITDRAIAIGFDIQLLNTSLPAYRSFVTQVYDKPYARQALQRQLFALGGKTQTPAEAWAKVRKLAFCYDEKAKRAKAPPLTEREKSDFFISALFPGLRIYLFSLLQQRHPDVATAEKAYQAAEDFIRHSKFFGDTALDNDPSLATDASVLLSKQTAEQSSAVAPSGKRQRSRNRIRTKAPQHHTATVNFGQTKTPPAVGAPNTPIDVDSTISMNSTFPSRPASGRQHCDQKVMRCNFCNMPGHTESVCRKKQRALATSTAQRGAPMPSCAFCGKRGHEDVKCWNKYPHLRPTRPWLMAPEAAKQQAPAANLAISGDSISPQPLWTHPADPRAPTSVALLLASLTNQQPCVSSSKEPNKPPASQCNCLLYLTAFLSGHPLR